MNQDENLLDLSARLGAFFRRMSTVEGFPIHPVVSDASKIIMSEILYEEVATDRWFYVCRSDPERDAFDAFTKRTGVDFEILLFKIFIPADERYFPALWELYVKWMHDRIDEDAIIGAFDGLAEKLNTQNTTPEGSVE
jgi:hypothetical protein